MRTALALVAVAVCGCNGSNEVPGAMRGSFWRSDVVVAGTTLTVARLEVTTTGMAVSASQTTHSIDVLDVRLATQRLGTIESGSALFESVRCTTSGSCRFATRTDCSGALTLDDAGIVVLAEGGCAQWSGRWNRGAPPSDPSTRVPAPQAGSHGNLLQENVSCHLRCGDERLACENGCGQSFDCTSGCARAMDKCMHECRVR